ncbi:hypothetical protein EDB92DRAFT_1946706 [Lactarius akahatsu]|uniref:Uncharacterized protein n=1 Tax=Lactarius akahatsu TaxID=416441 RepID=A0AAD4LIN5_9AGAM|nr:hypothetical protein EDB92DRAFT_1946706 [Lactarius akahatsu]
MEESRPSTRFHPLAVHRPGAFVRLWPYHYSFCETWIYSPESTASALAPAARTPAVPSPPPAAVSTLTCAKDTTLEKTAEGFPQQHASETTDQTTDPATDERPPTVSRTPAVVPLTPYIDELPDTSPLPSPVVDEILPAAPRTYTPAACVNAVQASSPFSRTFVKHVTKEGFPYTPFTCCCCPLPPQHRFDCRPIIVPRDNLDRLLVLHDSVPRTVLPPLSLSRTTVPAIARLAAIPTMKHVEDTPIRPLSLTLAAPTLRHTKTLFANLVAHDDSIRIKDPSLQFFSPTLDLACLVAPGPHSLPHVLALPRELVSAVADVVPLRPVLPSHQVPRSSAFPSHHVLSLDDNLSTSPASPPTFDPRSPAALLPWFPLPLHPARSPFAAALLFDPTSRSPWVVMEDNIPKRGVKTSQVSVSTPNVATTTRSNQAYTPTFPPHALQRPQNPDKVAPITPSNAQRKHGTNPTTLPHDTKTPQEQSTLRNWIIGFTTPCMLSHRSHIQFQESRSRHTFRRLATPSDTSEAIHKNTMWILHDSDNDLATLWLHHKPRHTFSAAQNHRTNPSSITDLALSQQTPTWSIRLQRYLCKKWQRK